MIVRVYLFLILSALSNFTFANNGYCDSRPSRYEVERCYKSAADGEWSKYNWNMGYISNAPSLSQENKTALETDKTAWELRVAIQCHDNGCIFESVKSRNYALVRYAAAKKIIAYAYTPKQKPN